MGMLDNNLHCEGRPAIWPEWATVVNCTYVRTLYKTVRTETGAEAVYIYTAYGWRLLGINAHTIGPWGESTGPFQEGLDLAAWARKTHTILYNERTGKKIKHGFIYPRCPRAPRGKSNKRGK